MPRERRRSRVTRARLVEAAAVLTEKQGFESTSMAQIAQQAGVATSTLYHHFPDKRTLLLALIEEWSERLVAERRSDLQLEAFARSEPRAFLAGFLRKVYERLQDRNWIYVELFLLVHRDDELRARFRTLQDAGIERLAMIIEFGQQQGKLRREPEPRRAAILLGNSLEMLAVQLHILTQPIEETEALLDELTEMICRYLVEEG